MIAATDALGHLAGHGALGKVVNDVRALSEDQVSVEDGQVFEVLKSLLLSFISQLKRRVLVLCPEKFVFNWADCHELLNSVFLAQLCGGLDEVVLVRGAGEIVVGEVQDVLCSFEGDVEVSRRLHLVLLQLYAAGEGSLE